jgi:hypothetical protein
VPKPAEPTRVVDETGQGWERYLLMSTMSCDLFARGRDGSRSSSPARSEEVTCRRRRRYLLARTSSSGAKEGVHQISRHTRAASQLVAVDWRRGKSAGSPGGQVAPPVTSSPPLGLLAPPLARHRQHSCPFARVSLTGRRSPAVLRTEQRRPVLKWGPWPRRYPCRAASLTSLTFCNGIRTEAIGQSHMRMVAPAGGWQHMAPERWFPTEQGALPPLSSGCAGTR